MHVALNGTCSKCSFQGWKPQVMKGCFNFPKVVCWSRYQWCHVHPFFWASFPDEQVVNIAHYLVLPFIWMKSSMTVKGSSRVWDTTGTHTIWQCKTPAAAFPFPNPYLGFWPANHLASLQGFFDVSKNQWKWKTPYLLILTLLDCKFTHVGFSHPTHPKKQKATRTP